MTKRSDKPTAPKTEGPVQAEIVRVTNTIVEGLGSMDLESALTVLCNLTGQLVAVMSKGDPAMVKRHATSVAANITTAAFVKIMDEDNKRREAQRKVEERNA